MQTDKHCLIASFCKRQQIDKTLNIKQNLIDKEWLQYYNSAFKFFL